MANDEHVAILKKGVDAWNKWRDHVGLSRVDFRGADLSGADLSGADLSGLVDLSGANLSKANLSGANLSGADLRGTDLLRANLSRADLSGADLRGANLIRAKFNEADLSGADLLRANLSRAELSGADLSRADLHGANLIMANLLKANLTEAVLGDTVFGATTLSEVKGLDQCRYAGPSIVDFRTLKNSGPLPIAFLRGVGLPDNLIEYLPSLLNEAIQFYSCFISYSGKDKAFAERLHADLQNQGVRCWFAPHDMRIGAKLLDAIDGAIRLRDKVLLILSKNAIASGWVGDEVNKAYAEERQRGQNVVFPVRLDNTILKTDEPWASKLRDRNIGDFTRWKEHDSYQKSFERLMRDLRVEGEGGS